MGGRTFGSISIDDSDGQLRASVRIHAVETGAAVLEHAFTVGTRVKDARPLSWPRQVPLFDGITKRAFAVFDAIPPQFQRVLGLHTLTTRHKAVERVAASCSDGSGSRSRRCAPHRQYQYTS